MRAGFCRPATSQGDERNDFDRCSIGYDGHLSMFISRLQRNQKFGNLAPVVIKPGGSIFSSLKLLLFKQQVADGPCGTCVHWVSAARHVDFS